MKALMLPLCLLALFPILGCLQEEQPAVAMSLSEALQATKGSECLKQGSLTGDRFYNNDSRTWWFGLDIKKQGCAPACVVNENRTAEINWRCTGLIVP